ncbi:Rho guanine nucleotide exchange factor 17 [Amphibalanus amphitrite]|uniref:Rho guanine nucleotide exchange factor 17 n=1 Tax=Amphibalanus amphitrite TaxID=1232801 RepID=A0A6A4X905_AMPAM|nr:Rho guanine nucleotide exchange factor 17 [Amphibalanus amphitrite]
MLREIQMQSLSLQRRDSSGLLQRQSHSADGWGDVNGRPARLGGADLSRAVSADPPSAANEVTRPDGVSSGQKSANAPGTAPARPAVERCGSSVDGDGEMASQTTGATTDAAAPATVAAEAAAAGGRPKLRRPLLPGSSDSGTSGDEPREPRFADLSPVIITHGQREEAHRASSSLRLPSAAPCSDGELPQLPGAEQELTQLLSEALYDGVGPTARRMLAQVTSGQDQPGVQAQGRRVFIIGELLDTEQRYVESLRLLVEYHDRLSSADPGGLIDSVALEDIFQMIPEMLEIHEGFLADLTEKTDHWSADQGIGEVFLNKLTHSAVLETYAAFVNHWPEAREALRLACQTRPELAKTLEALERADKRRLSLTQLLIAPVQRIPRYELLLKVRTDLCYAEKAKTSPNFHMRWLMLVEIYFC